MIISREKETIRAGGAREKGDRGGRCDGSSGAAHACMQKAGLLFLVRISQCGRRRIAVAAPAEQLGAAACHLKPFVARFRWIEIDSGDDRQAGRAGRCGACTYRQAMAGACVRVHGGGTVAIINSSWTCIRHAVRIIQVAARPAGMLLQPLLNSCRCSTYRFKLKL